MFKIFCIGMSGGDFLTERMFADKGSCSFDTKMIFGQEKTKFSQCMIKVSISEGHDGKHISLTAMYMLSNKRHDFIWKFPGISRHAKNKKRS